MISTRVYEDLLKSFAVLFQSNWGEGAASVYRYYLDGVFVLVQWWGSAMMFMALA